MNPNERVEFDRIAKGFQNICETYASFSALYPPPGKNAANGWFVGKMKEYGPTPVPAYAIAGSELPRAQAAIDPIVALPYNIWRTLQDIDSHYAAWTGNWGLFIRALDEFGQDIGNVISSFFALISGNDDQDQNQQDKDKTDLAAAIEKLINDVKASKLVLSGAHANGWTAGRVSGAAGNSLDSINHSPTAHQTAPFAIPPADDWDRLIAILRTLCNGLQAMNHENMDPWLSPDWQVKFQSLMHIAATATRDLRAVAGRRAPPPVPPRKPKRAKELEPA
jgi:hypothetical protein